MTLYLLKKHLSEFRSEVGAAKVRVVIDGGPDYEVGHISYVTGKDDKPTLILHCKSDKKESNRK